MEKDVKIKCPYCNDEFILKYGFDDNLMDIHECDNCAKLFVLHVRTWIQSKVRTAKIEFK